MICSRAYTTLAWFLGKPNPSPLTVCSVVAACQSNAVQLRRGDAKTLVASGLARHDPDRDLFPGRCNLPSEWTDTSAATVRDGTIVQARRPGSVSACRGVLWRVSDLQQHFAS